MVRQRARTRVLAGVAVGAALLDTGIISLIVALATRSVAGALAVPCAIVVVVAITMAVIGNPGRRVGFMDEADAREYLDRVKPVVDRVAAGLRIATPDARIVSDEALNALSLGSDRDGVIAYTTGLLDALTEPGDDAALEAVTAHLAGRLGCGDNRLAVFSYGALAWIVESFDTVMRLIRRLRRAGGACVSFAFGVDVHDRGDPESTLARVALLVFALAFGIELLLAALALFVVTGVLALIAAVALKAQAGQRMRYADTVAAELAGHPETLAALQWLGGQPTGLSRGGVTVQDLCFAGPPPVRGHVEYTPRLERRAAWLESGETRRDGGLLAPVSAGLVLVAVLGVVGFGTAKVPYGRPFGPAFNGAAATPLAVTSSSGAVTPSGQQPTGLQPGFVPTQQATTSPGGGQGAGTGSSGSSSQQTSATTATSSTTQTSSTSQTSTGSSSTRASQPPPSPPVSVPAAPSAVTAIASGPYQITVTWVNDATNATGFYIDNGCPPGSCPAGATLATTTGLTTSVSFATTPGAYQCFRVQALNGAGRSAFSGWGCISTPGFTLAGTQAWADTGVTVPAGILLKITASGTVNVTAVHAVTPAGDQSCTPAAQFPRIDPPFAAPGLPCWSLVARIGDGPPFEVGGSATITTTAGRLYLSVNDNNFTDNSGNWTVSTKEGG
jgi:Zn-dependent protease with chaperone function